MKKNNKKTFSLLTVLLAVLAVCLLVVGGIGVTRAVLIESDTYSGTLETPEIAVQLNENGKAVSGEDALLQDLLKDEEALAIGKHYKEELTVTNTGTADQFVRVTLYKYWTDDEGKRVDLDTDYIGLVLGEDWLVDESATTDERVVLYYSDKLFILVIRFVILGYAIRNMLLGIVLYFFSRLGHKPCSFNVTCGDSISPILIITKLKCRNDICFNMVCILINFQRFITV